MLTINSSEIFNSFQNLVKETNTLSGALQDFSKQLKTVSDEQQKTIEIVRKNIEDQNMLTNQNDL